MAVLASETLCGSVCELLWSVAFGKQHMCKGCTVGYDSISMAVSVTVGVTVGCLLALACGQLLDVVVGSGNLATTDCRRLRAALLSDWLHVTNN